MNSDDLYDTIRGDVQKLWSKRNRKTNLEDYMNTQNYTTEMNTRNTKLPTKPGQSQDFDSENLTIADIKRRMQEREAWSIIEQNNNHLESFANGVDETAVITRRFDQISWWVNRPIGEVYDGIHWYETQSAKLRTIGVMAQFVYVTRYRLEYSQLLRKKYMQDVKYKIGYCFALLRLLKTQQLILYTTMVNNVFLFRHGDYPHLRVYEKIVRLDVDIRDVIKLIKQLEHERKMVEFPNYYAFFPVSTGRAWRRSLDKNDTTE